MTLFDTKCSSSGGVDLPNGAPWTFVTDDKCEVPLEVPPTSVELFQYFTFDKITYNQEIPADHKMTVTITYDCTGACGDQTNVQRSFDLLTPGKP